MEIRKLEFSKRLKLFLLSSCFICIGAAQAAPIDFTFTNPATLNFGSGVGTQSFSGGFTYDVTTKSLTNVNVVMTGNVNTVFNGTWSSWNGNRYIGLTSAGDNNDNGVMAFLQFQYALDGLNSPSLFVSGSGNGIYNTAYGNAFSGSGATGGLVVAPTDVPEPAPFLLLSAGLLFLGMVRKQKRV